MDTRPSLVIIAALQREVAPLIRDRRMQWRSASIAGLSQPGFQNGSALVICGGIGAAAARAAAELALREFQPALLVSAGLAGALVPTVSVGEVICPKEVVVAATGQRRAIRDGREGILVSASEVAGVEGKRLLARQYSAHAVDMEAGPIAAAAEERGVEFLALKAISDDADFAMPDMAPFIAEDGQFLTRKFVARAIFSPGTWGTMRELGRNTTLASVELCRELRSLIESRTART